MKVVRRWNGGEMMAVRCPCGIRVEGEDERETSANVREHLMTTHDVPPQRLMDVVGMRDELGEATMDELMSLDTSMRAHLAPPTRTQDEIRRDAEDSCMVGCVSELPMTREQTGQYNASMFCSFCARRLVADDENELSDRWGEHLAEHASSGIVRLEQVITR